MTQLQHFRRNVLISIYLSGAFLAALLGDVLDLDQEFTALLVEMEEVVEAVLLATCNFPRLRHNEGVLSLSLAAPAGAINIAPFIFIFWIVILIMILTSNFHPCPPSTALLLFPPFCRSLNNLLFMLHY